MAKLDADRPEVLLRPLDEPRLAELLDAAVAGAEPDEVMPPVPGPPGWTAERRRAFLDFHRSRSIGTEQPVEETFVIYADGRAAGAARLEGTWAGVEAGLWVTRGQRGRGVGGAAVRRLRELAAERGHQRLIAATTPGNTAARRLLAAAGAHLVATDTSVQAVIEL
ncbi:GNAT family N-acetyltransferase [Allonocardiopsis opalescens]|nr:GNAT family N-acetyltransferase [Allonocardiopsis opalescens]